LRSRALRSNYGNIFSFWDRLFSELKIAIHVDREPRATARLDRAKPSLFA
jgi:sterol desaturase/sphingolipid hydroxylase (fatty acid hydroxylase superfamily)